MRRPKETVVLQRPVAVECVPSGAPLDLPAGTVADVTQALGTNFTLVVGGQMVRLRDPCGTPATRREMPSAIARLATCSR